MSSAEKVSARIQRMKRGVPFAISGFYSLGSRASVEKAMSRLAKAGVVSRVSKGFYVRPKPLKSIPSISVTTSAKQVAQAWAKEHGYKLVSQGEESAYRLGFQTQAPVKTILWSNGPTRHALRDLRKIQKCPLDNFLKRFQLLLPFRGQWSAAELVQNCFRFFL